MSVLRHEKQQYATPAALTAEVIVPTANDSVYVESLKRTFDWIEGSTATADDLYVIDQTSETANGRWVASSVANVYTGTGNTDALENGQMSVVDITVTGASASKANLIALTNAGTFPANTLVISKEVVAADTVRVVVENQSGAAVAAFAINATVLEF
jgi:hypothetical protein